MSQQFKFMKFSANIQAGFGSLKNIGNELKEMGIRGHIIIIAGETSFAVAGKIIVDSLSENGYQIDTLIENHIEPTVYFVENLKARVRNLLIASDSHLLLRPGIGFPSLYSSSLPHPPSWLPAIPL